MTTGLLTSTIKVSVVRRLVRPHRPTHPSSSDSFLSISMSKNGQNKFGTRGIWYCANLWQSDTAPACNDSWGQSESRLDVGCFHTERFLRQSVGWRPLMSSLATSATEMWYINTGTSLWQKLRMQECSCSMSQTQETRSVSDDIYIQVRDMREQNVFSVATIIRIRILL